MKMLNDAYHSVKRLCHSGLGTVALRQQLSACIAPVVPHEAYAFSTTDPDTGLLTHTVAQGVPDEMMRAYCAYFYPFETATVVLDAVWSDHPLFSLWQAVPALQSAMRSTGLRFDVHLSLADRNGFWGDWCIMREQRSRSADVERKFLERIRPHVTHALRTGALMDAARDSVGEEAPVTSPCVLLLDSAGQPVVRAGPVASILDDLADDGVPASDRLPGSIINAASRVRRQRSDVPAEAVLRVRGKSARWYTVRALQAEPNAAGDANTVVLIRPIAAREKAVLLTRLYCLSEREREVAAAVARGESTKLIARRLSISPHTVKEHLDRACAKIGVRGRKALVARLFFDAQTPAAAS